MEIGMIEPFLMLSSDPESGISRRHFIRQLAASTLLASATRLQAAPPSDQRRPNILWIMTDQQFAGAMSCTGARGLLTPAMDGIAARGMRFEKAYCSNPICVPSRASMITGKYPHEIGVTTNYRQHDIDAPSVGDLMRQAGYRTGYVGKWHIPMPNTGAAWHGFDFIRHAEVNGIDEFVAPTSIEFLSGKQDRPWFLVSSFVNPHDICEWARMASGRPDALKNGPLPAAPPPEACPPLPANFGIPENEPSVIRQLQNNPAAAKTYPVQSWDEATWRQYRWAYHRLVEKVDAQIAALLDALRISGQLDNTLIIFTSDHGDGMGAHHWNQKTLFYEECARVPFVIAGPGVAEPGSVNRTALVSTGLDIAATVLDFAGTPLDHEYHGRSLRPVVEGRSATLHEYVVAESDLAPRYNESGGIFGRMLRTQRYKYVVYSEGGNPEQLFDLEEDPGEMRSLVDSENHQHILEQHRDLLRHHLKETLDTFTSPVLARR